MSGWAAFSAALRQHADESVTRLKCRLPLVLLALTLAGAACTPTQTPSSTAPVVPKVAEPPAGTVGQSGTTSPLTQPVHLRFASQEVGSGWYLYAASMAELLKLALPPGSTIDVLPHAAAIGNPKNISAGQAEVGFGLAVPTSWAYRGIVAYDQKLDNLRALVGGLDEYYLGVVVRRDLGIDALTDIKDRRIPVRMYTVPRGGVGEVANRQVLEALGLSYEAIQAQGGSVQNVGFNVITEAFRSGRADLFMHTVNVGHPSMTEIATTADVKFLPLPDQVIQELGKYGWPRATMPAGTFPKQDQPLQTVGDFTILITSADLPDDIAYVVTKTIVENKEALASANAALKAFKPEEAWKQERTAVPLHPGAERYYRERGWLK